MLKVDDLKFGYGYRVLFSSLSFELSQGQLLKIEGCNGVGKSSLLKVIAGLASPLGGSIRFYSQEEDLSLKEATEYVGADENGLFMHLSAFENLNFWAKLRSTAMTPQRVSQELSCWGLGGAWLQTGLPVAKFSTGMRRRLCLARLNLANAKVWLLDEPINGLDHEGGKIFVRCLRNHLDHGGAAILVSHESLAYKFKDCKKVHLGEASLNKGVEV